MWLELAFLAVGVYGGWKGRKVITEPKKNKQLGY